MPAPRTRRRATPRPSKLTPRTAIVAGSGTGIDDVSVKETFTTFAPTVVKEALRKSGWVVPSGNNRLPDSSQVSSVGLLDDTLRVSNVAKYAPSSHPDPFAQTTLPVVSKALVQPVTDWVP